MLMNWVRQLDAAWSNRADIASDLLAKWNDDSAWDRGQFQGKALGWVAMTAILAAVTGGVVLVAKAGRFATIASALDRVGALGDVTTYVGKGIRLPEGAADAIRKRVGGGSSPTGTATGKTTGADGSTRIMPGDRTSELHPPKPTLAKPPRVTDPIPGLYDSIDPDHRPPGWVFVDKGPMPHKDDPEIIWMQTKVTAPDGTRGRLDRSYDPRTKTVVMHNAFLDALPSKIEGGIPMSPDGTPRHTYLMLRQMKMLDVAYGGVQKVKMSTIQNVEAVVQLDLMRRDGIPLEKAVAKTHSVEYATTAIQQSGHTIIRVEIDMTQKFPWKLSEMMDHFGWDLTKRETFFDRVNKGRASDKKIGPDDVVDVNYDIVITVGRHPKA